MAEVLPLARPKKPISATRRGSETRERQRRVTFRLSLGEYALLEEAADRAGLSVGSYVRSRALANPTTRATRRPTMERAALSQILGQLGRIGGNLAQITKALNFGRIDWPEGLREEVEGLRELRCAILAAMGRGTP